MTTHVIVHNKDVFQSDPSDYNLVNQGVAKLEVPTPPGKMNTLRGELLTFVCDGKYAEGLAKILDAYLGGIGRGDAPAVWISGFYGSGKSQLASMLAALWSNVEFPDHARARGLVAELPEDVRAHLKELDVRAAQNGGLFEAGGSMEGGGDPAALVLGMVFRAIGLPEQVRDAEIAFWLADEGILDAVRARLGEAFAVELARATLSTKLAEAVLAEKPSLGSDAKELRDRLKHEFPNNLAPTLEDLERLVRRALTLGRDKEPLALIVLDEVQQFLNPDPALTLTGQPLGERLSSAFGGRVLVVATGQQALGDLPNLQKLLGRFRVTVALGDSDIDRVIRKTVLKKKAGVDSEIRNMLERCSGEVHRQLQGSALAQTPADADDAVADWPLLPSRRRLWRTILTEMDKGGLKGNLRGQLQTTVDAVKAYADRPLGHAVPGDFLYTRVGEDAYMGNLLPRETWERIETLRAGTGDDALKARMLMLVYMLQRIAPDADRHGVRAKAETLADLLIEDLAGEPEVRRKVPELLTELQEDGALVEIEGGEWRLQTKESAEWEAAFKAEKRRAADDPAGTARRRSEALGTALDDALKTVGSVNQGTSKTPRKIQRLRPDEKAGDGLVLRVHDGYSEDLAQVELEVLGASPTDPTVHLLIPREQAEPLAQAIQTRAAADAVIAARGVGGTADAQEARKGMDNRLRQAEETIRAILTKAVSGAKVMQAGGAVASGATVAEAVRDAAQKSAVRLYPKFSDADHAGWGKAYEKAARKEPDALQAVDWSGEAEKHPVAQAILGHLGAGKTGRELRANFGAEPYGWPQDAVDSLLLVLANASLVRVTGEGGQAVNPADESRSKLPSLTFRSEAVVVSTAQKLAVRKLLDDAKVAYQPGSEAVSAPQLVQALEAARQAAGGQAPAPEAPASEPLAKAGKLTGAELMVHLAGNAEVLFAAFKAWRGAAGEIAARLPRWRLLERLVGLGADGQKADVETLRASRSLLAEPDPTPALLQAAADDLRGRLNAAFEKWQAAWNAGEARLKVDEAWEKLDQSRKHELRLRHKLMPRERPKVDAPEAVALALESANFALWEAEAKALPQRVADALKDAAIELEPKTQYITLSAPVLKSEAELDAWMAGARRLLADALKNGPVVPEL